MESRIIKVIEDINPDILQYEGDNMLEEGVADSFEIIDIVNGLEEEFNIEIDAALVIASNFANKDSIIEMMKRIL